jgi:hypothetical protein
MPATTVPGDNATPILYINRYISDLFISGIMEDACILSIHGMSGVVDIYGACWGVASCATQTKNISQAYLNNKDIIMK